jgi:hypothetical protein
MTPETLLLRQIHPSFVQDGRVTSQAFRPTPKDEKKLSAYHGDKITAQDCWQHFTQQPDCRSAGVMAVSNTECTAQEVAVDPDGIPYPEHVSLDFSPFQENEIKKKAKVLARQAADRGWLFQPTDDF